MARKNRIDYQKMIQLNTVGYSLHSIARHLNCHPTTISKKFLELGIKPFNTRQDFTEQIYESLSDDQQTWLVAQLGPSRDIRGFIRGCIIEKFENRNKPNV